MTQHPDRFYTGLYQDFCTLQHQSCKHCMTSAWGSWRLRVLLDGKGSRLIASCGCRPMVMAGTFCGGEIRSCLLSKCPLLPSPADNPNNYAEFATLLCTDGTRPYLKTPSIWYCYLPHPPQNAPIFPGCLSRILIGQDCLSEHMICIASSQWYTSI